MKYDIPKLEALDINDVITALGGSYQKDREPGSNQYNMHCCNGSFHNEGDNKPSLTIWKDKNISKCHVCGIGGNPISVAKEMHKGDFKQACMWLHDTFSIPYIDGGKPQNTPAKKFNKPIQKPTEYMSFDRGHKFKSVKVSDWLKKYDSMSKMQQLKMVYTYIYRYSLTTERKKLSNYYQTRGIANSIHLGKIGFLSEKDIEILVAQLSTMFPLEDLIEFSVINDASHKFPLQWKQLKNAALVPAFDIYTDLIEGFMLRPVDKSNTWFKGKESRLSVPHILKPLPFGTGYKVLSGECDIYITEGHIDALSLPEELCFIATPGVQAFEKEQLGLLRGRNIKLAFDQDDAGQKAAWGYTEISSPDFNVVVLNNQNIEEIEEVKKAKSQGKAINIRRTDGFKDHLLAAGVASVEILTWDKKLGKDLNDLLVNGNLSKVIK